MSIVSQGCEVSCGALGGLGVVGSQCLGSPGSPLRVSDPFLVATPSLSCSDPPSQLQTQFHQGAGFVRCGVCLGEEGGLFVTPKVTGGWRPVIDLSRLNGWMELSSFHMETAQPILQSLCPGDWMVSLDLQDAYLQVPVHPASRCYQGGGGRSLSFLTDWWTALICLCSGPSASEPMVSFRWMYYW